ncbi:hypothetical protein MX850_00465 [Erysipelothrix sp. Poltava]|nr:hypothetical protein MX850_00465 [Erysipelothrix sp. Poltava]
MSLRDKLQIYQKELALVRYRTDKIKIFLDSLEYSDRVIVTDIYIKNINIEKVGYAVLLFRKNIKAKSR